MSVTRAPPSQELKDLLSKKVKAVDIHPWFVYEAYVTVDETDSFVGLTVPDVAKKFTRIGPTPCECVVVDMQGSEQNLTHECRHPRHASAGYLSCYLPGGFGRRRLQGRERLLC